MQIRRVHPVLLEIARASRAADLPVVMDVVIGSVVIGVVMGVW